ncbi:hypothetical protein LCGC14_0728410 [marine sediment metagenome]|uniref:Uncharacterized protein n=1 Tax=marine sediment metagenome TaxID=412755 RepID=A0A0F9SVP6_9ZZZZ
MELIIIDEMVDKESLLRNLKKCKLNPLIEQFRYTVCDEPWITKEDVERWRKDAKKADL